MEDRWPVENFPKKIKNWINFWSFFYTDNVLIVSKVKSYSERTYCYMKTQHTVWDWDTTIKKVTQNTIQKQTKTKESKTKMKKIIVIIACNYMIASWLKRRWRDREIDMEVETMKRKWIQIKQKLNKIKSTLNNNNTIMPYALRIIWSEFSNKKYLLQK